MLVFLVPISFIITFIITPNTIRTFIPSKVAPMIIVAGIFLSLPYPVLYIARHKGTTHERERPFNMAPLLAATSHGSPTAKVPTIPNPIAWTRIAMNEIKIAI